MPRPQLSYTELVGNPSAVARHTKEFGAAWADRFAAGGGTGAEMIMRNPGVYTGREYFHSLPASLRTAWSRLQDRTAGLLQSMDPKAWADSNQYGPANPLELLQATVARDAVPAHRRSDVAEIIRESTALFAQSTAYVPGETHYFAGNVLGARIETPDVSGPSV